MRSEKYVVLEHLMLPHRGRRFWTTNSDNNCFSHDGEVWYKEVFFTDSWELAIIEAQKCNVQALPSYQELEEYYKLHNEY